MLRFRYQTFEFGNTDVHVRTLRDRQQFSDPEHIASKFGISSANWSLFGVIWASGEVLANLMFEHEIEGKRILEVGCGIALASLVLNTRLADITTTDYHPKAEEFLRENINLNNGRKIPFVRTGWEDDKTNLGAFDLIIGSDLLYERGHANLLAGFIHQHAKQTSEIIIIDPGRNNHNSFSRNMNAFGYDLTQTTYNKIEQLTQPIRGRDNFRILRYLRC